MLMHSLRHVPLPMAVSLHETTARAWLTRSVQVTNTLTHPAPTSLPFAQDVTGGCERILRTPVPLAYSRHNSRMLMLWMTLLPFRCVESTQNRTTPPPIRMVHLQMGQQTSAAAAPVGLRPLCHSLSTTGSLLSCPRSYPQPVGHVRLGYAVRGAGCCLPAAG